MHPVLAWAEAHVLEFKNLLRRMVECESPSDDAPAVNRFGDLLAEVVSGGMFGTCTAHRAPGGRYGDHRLLRFGKKGPGREQVLVLAHADTVWPLGTLATMPFREDQERLFGPGVLDVKGGIALFLFAIRAAYEMNLPLPDTVLLQVNGDEEIGSPSSRQLTEDNATQSKAVLVLEPGTGPTGKLKTERKGVGAFHLEVKGRAAHAGVDFERGASAVVELSHLIQRITRWTDLARGTTVNAGVMGGGTRGNVVPARAWADVDFRVVTMREAERIEKKFRALQPADPRCTLQVSGGLNRPPMEKSAKGTKLFRLAYDAGAELGFALEESLTGGGSDGNFTAALGVATLDGLGCVGEGAHAANESIAIGFIAARMALLTGLLGKLSLRE